MNTQPFSKTGQLDCGFTLKLKLQQITSSAIDFKDFMKLYQDYTKELYSVLVNNTTL